MANTITVELDLDTLNAQGQLKGFQSQASKGGKQAGEAAGSSFAKGFAQFLLADLGASAIREAFRGIANEISGIVDAGKSLEVIETQFKTLLGSTQAAQKQLEDLQNFAATTPFQLEGLSLATRQLLSFGTAQEDIIPTLRQLGDLAAGTGSRIDELTIPFGRLRSTQKLTLVELDKFADRGINIFGELSKQTGISLGEIRDAISKGAIPFSEFETALRNLTSEGGTFFRSTQAQSRTLSGVLSTLSDNLFNLRANLGKAFSPVIIAVVDKFTASIQEFNKSISNLDVSDVGNNFVRFNQAIIDFVIKPLELVINVVGVVKDALQAGFSAIIASVGTLGGAFGRLLSILGVGGELSQALMTFEETSNETFQSFAEDASNSINSIFDTPISDKIAVFNEELATGLAETSTIVNDSVANVNKAAASIPQALSKTAQAANKIINAGIVKSISGGIQTVISSLAKGQNALQAFGNFLLSTFGDLAIQLGEFYVATGLANLALLTVDPTAQIATGAALIALGGILKSFAGGGIGGSGASGGGGGTPLAESTESIDDPENFRDTGAKTEVNIQVQGSLVQQEELGAFINNVINESNEKNGIIQVSTRQA